MIPVPEEVPAPAKEELMDLITIQKEDSVTISVAAS